VAKIVRALREADVVQDTLVLFTSDNGPHREKGVTPWLFDSNGPLRADKRDLYEGGIRVPLIAWSPKLRSRVERQPVALYDILPTLADLAEVPVPDRIDGLSFRRLLNGRSAPRHDHLVWNRPRKAQAIRRGRWKAIRFAPGIAGAGPEGRVELYDLATDVGERRDLAGRRPELAAELMTLLDGSIGPDPRGPYGLKVLGAADQVTVTLVNGSAVPWQRVKLGLSLEQGRRLAAREEVATLLPGEECSAVFPVGGDRAVTASAAFRAAGRRHTFRRRAKVEATLT
jgi:arylsulfatase A-like enzyme